MTELVLEMLSHLKIYAGLTDCGIYRTYISVSTDGLIGQLQLTQFHNTSNIIVANILLGRVETLAASQAVPSMNLLWDQVKNNIFG